MNKMNSGDVRDIAVSFAQASGVLDACFEEPRRITKSNGVEFEWAVQFKTGSGSDVSWGLITVDDKTGTAEFFDCL